MNKIDKVADNFTDKIDKVAHKVEPNASEDQDDAWYQYGGEGTAIGEDTLTQAETTGKIVDHGPVTTAKINIKVTAVAEGDSPYASADTFVYSNADISRLIKFEEGSLEYDGVSYDIPTVKFIGVNLPDYINLPSGPKHKEVVIERDGDSDLVFDLDDNVATVTFDVEVLGDNTLANADAYALAIEDALSNSAFSIEAAVG